MSAEYATVPLSAFTEPDPDAPEAATPTLRDDGPPWWCASVVGRPCTALVATATGPVLHAALSPDARERLRAASYDVTGLTTSGGDDSGVRFCRVMPDRAARPIGVVLADYLDCR
jgi:hypothetical protein